MPNAWVNIAPDNTVTHHLRALRDGAGRRTPRCRRWSPKSSNVDLYKVNVEFAPPGEVYINALLGGQITGGSTSVRDGYDKLRIAGAQARDDAACRRRPTSGRSTRRQLRTRERLWSIGPEGQEGDATASSPPPRPSSTPPKEVALKDPSEFKHRRQAARSASTRRPRSTARPSSASTSSCPACCTPSLAQCPVIGGKVGELRRHQGEDDARRASDVVQITDGVAVVADSWWRARKARDTLDDPVGRRPGRARSSARCCAGLRGGDAAKPGAVDPQDRRRRRRRSPARRRRSRRPTSCRSCRIRRWSR